MGTRKLVSAIVQPFTSSSFDLTHYSKPLAYQAFLRGGGRREGDTQATTSETISAQCSEGIDWKHRKLR